MRLRNLFSFIGIAIFLTACVESAEAHAPAGGVGGVGLTLDLNPQNPSEYLIYTVSYKSPADKAMIRRGDKRLKIDGVAVTGMSLQDIANKIRGPLGSTVTLTIQGGGSGVTQDLVLTRSTIQQGPVVTVPPPQTVMKTIALSDTEKALVKSKIQGLTTDEQRKKMLELLMALKERKITKENFLTVINTQF